MSYTPTLHQYVQAYLQAMRAPWKETIVSTSAATSRVHSEGTRTLYGPKGEPIKITEDLAHGTHIEHGDHLHCVVRPQPIHLDLGVHRPDM